MARSNIKVEAKYTVPQVIAAAILINELDLTYDDDQVPSISSVLESSKNLPLEHAQEIIDTIISNSVIRVLKGQKTSDFAKKLAEKLQDLTSFVPPWDYGLLAHAPKFFKTISSHNEILNIASTSRWVGNNNDKITESLKVLSCRFIESNTPFMRYGRTISYGTYFALGVNEDGNLFRWSPKTDIPLTKDYSYKITAKIKNHGTDSYLNNAEVTRLFYVKNID